MSNLTQSQIEQAIKKESEGWAIVLTPINSNARKEKPCPRCGTTGHRARTDAGGKWLMKCLKFGCRGQWTEDKEKGE